MGSEWRKHYIVHYMVHYMVDCIVDYIVDFMVHCTVHCIVHYTVNFTAHYIVHDKARLRLLARRDTGEEPLEEGVLGRTLDVVALALALGVVRWHAPHLVHMGMHQCCFTWYIKYITCSWPRIIMKLSRILPLIGDLGQQLPLTICYLTTYYPAGIAMCSVGLVCRDVPFPHIACVLGLCAWCGQLQVTYFIYCIYYDYAPGAASYK